MPTILITGGSGLIGTALTKALLAQGHTVRHLSRRPRDRNGVHAFAWDVQRGTLDKSALVGVEHIVHLAGENIVGKRWSPERLKLCRDSRTESARLLLRAVRETGVRPKSFVSASGVGYYGAMTTDRFFNESDPNANDTIGRLTRAWEDAVDEWQTITRVVKLRTPMVLAREGGALPRFVPLAKWFILAPLGSGNQWMPWVHIEDLVRLYIHAMSDTVMTGAYNACASEQPQHRAFMRAIAKAVHRPLFPIAVPAFALRLALGEMSALLTEGSRVARERLERSGFVFEHNEVAAALDDLLKS
ncbi:MAG: TIGR01777 family oxidoreductase [Flavobacteriales bacterium]